MKTKRNERLDAHGRTFVDPTGEGVGNDFYVTVIDHDRTGFLLGPFDTHGEALANVELGKKLAEKHNTRACIGGYAYGTAAAKHGTEIKTVFGRGGCLRCVREFAEYMGRVRHCPWCGSPTTGNGDQHGS